MRAGYQMEYTPNGAPRFIPTSSALTPGDENWDPQFTNSLGASGTVHAVAMSATDVYVGGLLVNVGGVEVNNIARWNGSSWSALGSGVTGTVNAIAASGSEIYMGRVF